MDSLRTYNDWANAAWADIEPDFAPVGEPLGTIDSVEDLLAAMFRRGEWRGQAQRAGFTGFPDTDFVHWVRLTAATYDPLWVELCPAVYAADVAAWPGVPREDEWAKSRFPHHTGCPFGWGRGVATFLGRSWIDPLDDLMDELPASYTAWEALVREAGGATVYQWKRADGSAIEMPIGAIALHVGLHGAYHRGEITAWNRI